MGGRSSWSRDSAEELEFQDQRVARPSGDTGLEEAADGSRTRDLELGKLALYQLSYRRACCGSCQLGRVGLGSRRSTS